MMKILFRIPFTWYFVALTYGVQKECVSEEKVRLLCLVTKQWDSKVGKYYWYEIC